MVIVSSFHGCLNPLGGITIYIYSTRKRKKPLNPLYINGFERFHSFHKMRAKKAHKNPIKPIVIDFSMKNQLFHKMRAKHGY